MRGMGLKLCQPGLRYGLSPVKGEVPDLRIWLDRLLARCLAYRQTRQYTESNSSEWLGVHRRCHR